MIQEITYYYNLLHRNALTIHHLDYYIIWRINMTKMNIKSSSAGMDNLLDSNLKY
jgi:hypothetical protein